MATKVDREDQAEGIERMESSFQPLGGNIDLMQVHNLRGTDVELETMMPGKKRGGSNTSASRPTGLSSTGKWNSSCGTIRWILSRSITLLQTAHRLSGFCHWRTTGVLPCWSTGRLVTVSCSRQLKESICRIGQPRWTQELGTGVSQVHHFASGSDGTHSRHDQTASCRRQYGRHAGRMPDAGLRREIETFMDALL